MQKLANLIIFIIVFGVSMDTAFADSPITSTDFYRAYLDIDIVNAAHETNILSQNMADYLVDSENPIDVKMAIINALSWEKNAKKNSLFLDKYLESKYSKDNEKVLLAQYTPEERLCLFYMALQVDSFSPGFYLKELYEIKKELSDSFTVAVIYGLVKAQDVMSKMPEEYVQKALVATSDDERVKLKNAISPIFCMSWIIFNEEISGKNLVLDMRADAQKIIIDYMIDHKEWCEDTDLAFADTMEDGSSILMSGMVKSVIWDTSFSDQQKKILQNIVNEEELMMYLIDEFDFDENGQNEAVITYSSGAHSSGAKVIRFTDEGYEVIFERGSGTPNTQFEVVDGIPTFTFEESDFEPDYASGGRYEVIYLWNGKEFIS